MNGAVKGGTFDRVVIQGSDLVDAGGNTTVFLANVDRLQNPALRSVVPVPAENFLTKTAALLEFYVPSNVDRQVSSISYSGVAGTGPLRVENANGSGASPAPLNVFRTEFNVFVTQNIPVSQQIYRQLRYIGPSTFRGYEFFYEGAYFNNPRSVRGAQQAMREWRKTTTVNLGDNITNDQPITFNDNTCNIAFLTPTSSSPNMQTLVTGALCTDNTVNGQFVYILSIDILVHPNRPWHYEIDQPVPSNKLDFYSAILHEMGHASGLTHIDDASKVMHPVTPAPGTFRCTLNPEPEINGVANFFTRSQQQYTCQIQTYPALMRPLTVFAEQIGGQVALSDTLAFYDPCPNATTSLSFMASGTATYTWGSKTRFNGTYPHTSNVTTSVPLGGVYS